MSFYLNIFLFLKVHQPLVDLATYYKVQSVLKKKAVKVYYPELAFFTYRGLVKCGTCKRGYSPYLQKGINYYRSRCQKGCPNPLKHINDKFITGEVQKILDRIHFTELEISAIEANAWKELDKLTGKRNKQVEDLRLQKNKVAENLDFLTKDKLNLLRTPKQHIQGFFVNIRTKNLPVWMNIITALNVLSGLLLILLLYNSSGGEWFSSNYGIGISIGSVAAIAAYLIGFIVITPTSNKMNSIAKAMQRQVARPLRYRGNN